MEHRCLVDTNILLRLRNSRMANYEVCRDAIALLRSRDAPLFYTLQNAAEFWNVSTRPISQNGFGLSAGEASDSLDFIDEVMSLLQETRETYPAWRRLVAIHQVSGVQVHDAKLAAFMISHEVPCILTLNGRDFSRYSEIRAIHPASLF
jgi:predicted nucleic acid-binding protein